MHTLSYSIFESYISFIKSFICFLVKIFAPAKPRNVASIPISFLLFSSPDFLEIFELFKLILFIDDDKSIPFLINESVICLFSFCNFSIFKINSSFSFLNCFIKFSYSSLILLLLFILLSLRYSKSISIFLFFNLLVDSILELNSSIILIRVLNNKFKISFSFLVISFLEFSIFNNSECSKKEFKKNDIKLTSLLIILFAKQKFGKFFPLLLSFILLASSFIKF